jgi:Metallo-peptidase family M12/Secretion system C-terminal sorting domain
MKKFVLLLAVLFIKNINVNAQDMWQQLPNDFKCEGVQKIKVKNATIWKLNTAHFLNNVPNYNSVQYKENTTIFLPNIDGTLTEFYIFNNPVMAPQLAAKYNNIHTYTAFAKHNNSITAKLDYTSFGFHAMVLNGNKTYFIDPVTNINTSNYIVYKKSDNIKSFSNRMACELDENLDPNAFLLDSNLPNNGVPNGFQTNGTLIRNYRLAVACTGDYAYAVAGASPTIPLVHAAMVTSVNRVTGIYEKELSIHLTLVENNDTLINLDSVTDGYSNFTSSAMITENQSNIDLKIGTANYDIGHVFSTGGGGLASLGCVCGTSKARGVTGLPNPVGDGYDVDYVAHEMGHQFGCNHTFDAQTGSCNGNRSSQSAYEVGSGTTIMAYAGICDINDVQPHSDAYFCIRSLNAAATFINGNGNCSVNTPSGNTANTFTTIADTFFIPYLTFFELSKKAIDADGDAITYCWEQYDRTTTGINWDAPTTRNPIFRSFDPTNDSNRVFPKIENCLKNIYAIIGERAPDTNRNMRFKLCTRDVHNGYGSYNYNDDSVVVRSVITPSLFRVSSQNTAATITGGTTGNITWNVAGTDVGTIATPRVNIYLSTDSGYTYPIVLANNVANDGSQNIVWPPINAKACRVKVKGADNIFFDLNDINFALVTEFPAALNDALTTGLTVYPNPAKNVLFIDGNIDMDAVKIYNMLGNVVFSGKNNANGIAINNFSNGMYILKIVTANKSTKIVKFEVSK